MCNDKFYYLNDNSSQNDQLKEKNLTFNRTVNSFMNSTKGNIYNSYNGSNNHLGSASISKLEKATRIALKD